jgi:hypothetical protein
MCPHRASAPVREIEIDRSFVMNMSEDAVPAAQLDASLRDRASLTTRPA